MQHIKLSKTTCSVCIALCFLFFLACSESSEESANTSANNSDGEIKALSETAQEQHSTIDVLEPSSHYYVPSDYDILNAPPQEVIEYRSELERKNLESILKEIDIDIEEEIGAYLEKEARATKSIIFSQVP